MPQADNPSEYDSMPDLNQIQLASGVTALAQGAATGVRGCKVVRLLDRTRRQSWCLIHSSSLSQADADEVTSSKEAKQLAYYLFWNVRPPGADRWETT